jgi:hypothetical protein
MYVLTLSRVHEASLRIFNFRLNGTYELQSTD